ncbi:hypothetical protein D6B98_21370 [Bradyrhizobium sp. LVM 105]|nr:hypothetical protein D6B98_21370 [Bradyrhizobium sp. LVM 105]
MKPPWQGSLDAANNFKLGQRCAFGRIHGLTFPMQAGMFGGRDRAFVIRGELTKEITAWHIRVHDEVHTAAGDD